MEELPVQGHITLGIPFGKAQEYQLALGEMVMEAGRVEWGVAGLVWQMLDIDEDAALALTDGLQFESMCSLATRLASLIRGSKAEKQVSRAVAAARQEIGRRNLMVHAIWPYTMDGSFKQRLRVRPPRAQVVEVEDIKDITDKLIGTSFEIQLAEDVLYESTGRRPRNPI
jgi:hypothetical protein